MDLGQHSRSKRPSEVGLKYEAPSLWFCFVTVFREHQNPKYRAKVAMATRTPSTIPIVALQMTVAIFSITTHLTQSVPHYYLICGHQGMAHLQVRFPNLCKFAAYGFLLGLMMNNFAAFTGTLVE